MLKNSNFREILSKSEFAVILISGDGCANCISMYPIVNNLNTIYTDIDTYFVEVDEENFEINEEYGVEVVPTILITTYGKLIAKIKGYQPEEIFTLYIESKYEEIKKKDKVL